MSRSAAANTGGTVILRMILNPFSISPMTLFLLIFADAGKQTAHISVL
jgi:hypothetical protein